MSELDPDQHATGARPMAYLDPLPPPFPQDAEHEPAPHRAKASSRLMLNVRRGKGTRVARPGRRARTLPGTVGMTALSAILPGVGYLYSGRRWLGSVVLVAWVAVVGAAVWYFAGDAIGHSADLAFHTTLLRWVVVGIATAFALWAAVVLTSYLSVRAQPARRLQSVVGYVTVAAIVVGGAAPAFFASDAALATASTIEKVFPEDPQSPTIPAGVTEENPWAGKDRVNVLLLGGDGGEGRTGVRTDSMILASIDTETGKTFLFSLPRNMMYAQFPKNSPLHDIYPDGYGRGGTLDPAFYELNAIYGQVPINYPGILGKSDNEGADAIKEAVAGTLGIHVDYYMLVELKGFQTVVDAMGGITVNVNEPVAINGNTDLNLAPTGWIEPGPKQHLDGFHALWFARGRFGADDYQRMDRQRCAINALVHAADPASLLEHYIGLAKASRDVLYTDIPRKLGPAFVDLLLKVKDASVRSVVFRRSDKFYSGDPNFHYVHKVVRKALHPSKKKHGKGHHHEAEVEKPKSVCAYNPAPGVTMSDGSPVPQVAAAVGKN